jgi:hypothetical protein
MLLFKNTANYSCPWFLGLAIFVIFNISSCKTEPSVKVDGVYQHKEGGNAYYLRFFPDGEVISVTSTGTPKEIAKWFNKSSDAVSKGQYTISGPHIKFSSADADGTVDYEGEIKGDELLLKTYSHINGYRGSEEYKFVKN